MKNKRNNKGFTLAELLIVVAIIAVLVAIAIPIFTAQLEKSKEATDAANIRSAYAEVMSSAIAGEASGNVTESDGVYSATVNLKQGKAGWQNTFDFPANLTPANGAAQPTVEQTGVTISSTDGGASINILLVKKTD